MLAPPGDGQHDDNRRDTDNQQWQQGGKVGQGKLHSVIFHQAATAPERGWRERR